MAINLQQAVAVNDSGGTSALVLTPGAAVTAGNGLIVAVGSVTNGPSSVVDSQSTGLTQIRTTNFFGSQFSSLYWLATSAGGATSVTVNFGSSTVCCAALFEVIGTLTANAGNAAFANTTTASAGAITTSAANTIAVACLQDGVSITQPAGYAMPVNARSCGVAYLVYTSTQAGINPTWANTSGGTAATIEAWTSSVTTDPVSWQPTGVRQPALPQYLDDLRGNARRMPPALLSGSSNSPSTWQPYAARSFSLPPPAEPPARADGRRPLLFGVTPSPLPPGPGKSDETPFVRRLPAGTSPDDKRRSERIHDQLSFLLNSLIGQGILVQSSTSQWTLRGGARVETRHPTMVDDLTQGVVVGALWVCSTDQTTYLCVSNAHNAAVWKAF